MARHVAWIAALVQLLVIVDFESWIRQRGGLMVEGGMEAQFEKCCGLGTSWAKEGLRCEKFTGPVVGVPRVEQGLCLEAVDICCVRAYHEQQCAKGKSDARAGLDCIKSIASKTPGRGDYHRDCCEGCKLGILTGSMGQGCAFKSFTFGIPWDPAFLECCHEASPSTTTDFTSESTNATYSSSESTETSSSWSPSSSSWSSPSSASSPSSSASSPSSSASSPSSSSFSPSSSSSSFSPSSPTSSETSYSPSIPTPSLDDICQLIKGLCSDICVPTPGSYYCACRDGFTLLEDGKTCRQDLPADRCKGVNPCEQRCTDTGVAVICSCNPGYVLADDKRSCNPITSRNKPESDEDNELTPLCPAGYRYNATYGVCNDKDECIEENPCSGQCINTIGSYLCMEAARNTYETCPPGYQWEERTKVCVDIDECTVLTNPCNETGLWCVNTQGSFTCLHMKSSRSCPAGFKYDNVTRTCKDVDECAEMIHGCHNETEECRNTEGAYECDVKCGKGYVYSIGLGTCVDIDECTESSRPCPEPGTRCINTMGGYECSRSFDGAVVGPAKKSDPVACPAGYKATNGPPAACIDVDECYEQLHSCGPNEICLNKLGSYRCESREEVGDDLIGEENGDDERDLQYSTGRRGISTIIPSAANEAEVARCQPGFTFDAKLRQCVDVDECANDYTACGIGERCVNRIGGYDCSPLCPAGFQAVQYRGSESCQDVDECRVGLHTCNTATHTCVNTNGSYTCQILTTTSTTTTTTTTTTLRPSVYSRSNKIQSAEQYWSIEPCRLGYRRDQSTGFCVDVDECRVGPGCRDHEKCHNTPGGYECSPLCTTGWFFNPTTKGCQDVDECLLGRHDCQQGTHQCVNTNGSYTCEVIPPCRSGFRRSFNGSCVDIDECSEKLHNCRLEMHQYCINREGYFECTTRLPSCPAGYRYSISARDCEDIDECATGRYTCDVRFSERCVNLPGSYRCERPSSHGQRQRQRPACPSGYHYDPHLRRCTDIDECAEGLDSCGEETCYNQPGGYTCSKLPTPMTRRPPTTPLPAPANEKCIEGTRFVRNQGCVDINECRELEDACGSDEQCVNTVGSYICNCKTGFRRENLTQACVDINECQLQQNDCLPTQRCDNTIGSYICTRFLPCGTGYTLNAATEVCEDDDECLLGTHDCGEGYHCRNTLGSYRCDRNPRVPPPQARTAAVNPFTTTTTTTTTTTPRSLTPHSERVNCPRGFEPGSGGKCMDIDECQRNPNPCGRSMQRCVNTIGSYRCASRVICGKGYALDESGRHCVDVDECAEGSHQCSPEQTCENRQGSYLCTCPPGHVEGPNRDCIDIDECSIYGGRVCGSNSNCENTVGSYKCNCEAGFEHVDGISGGSCQDVDECQRSPGLCQHVCVNTWGSYRCGCELGFRLSADNRSCADIDECEEFKNNNLCIGICENTPGSYSCKCPDGYRLGVDGRTCQDIDECAAGQVCRRPDEMCQNTRGGFRCNRIDCPSGYFRDTERKNRCMRQSTYCRPGDLACFRSPSHFSYNFITFVSMLPIPPSGQLELFTMRGSHLPTSTIQFSMALVDARAPPGVQRATESCFALRRPASSQAVLVMTRSIPGPQEIELNLSMEIYHNAVFAGSAVAKLFIFVSQYEF